MNTNRLYHHQAMRILRRAILRELRLQFVASVVLLAISSAVCVITFKINVVFSVIGFGVSMIAGKLVVDTAANLRIDNHFLLNYLRYQPQHIVWVYSAQPAAPQHFNKWFWRQAAVHFRLDTGAEYTAKISLQNLRLVMKFLLRLLPQATFGYSTDLEYLYRVSPERLRRSDGEASENSFF